MGELRERDLRTVREQLGREPTTPFVVVVRCAPDGHPLVIRNAPLDGDGHPFPTTFWLSCPAATAAVSRIESKGAIGELNARETADPEFWAAVEQAHQRHSRERARFGPPEAATWGGVGGTRRGVKCLHAHYSNHLAGGQDVVGAWVAQRVEPIHGTPSSHRIAVIDQGTNSTRLLIVEPALDGDPLELARDMVITRLGDGVDQAGMLSDEALARTREVLELYGARVQAMHAGRIRVAATSAVRDARNRATFETAVRDATGADLEIITGEEEAALSFLGATEHLALDDDGLVLVVDIGGGSTEFIVGTPGHPGQAVSMQMGSVRLTERFVDTDPPSADALIGMRHEIDKVLEEVERALPEVGQARTLVAVAGTATTMQAVALGLPRYDPDRIHGSHLTDTEAKHVLSELTSMTTAERAALPVMAPGRADVIVAGAEILVQVLEHFGFASATVSEHDILDGLAVETLRRPVA